MRQTDVQSRWRVRDDYLTLSVAILPTDDPAKRSKPIPEEWTAVMAPFKSLVRERELFSDWRTGVRSLTEAGRTVDALVEDLAERLVRCDEQGERYHRAADELAAELQKTRLKWLQIDFLSKTLFGKPDQLLDEYALYLADHRAALTRAAAWSFAKPLIAEILGELGMAQVADLFSGRIADWSGVGGPAGPVKLYARKPPSGTLDFFKDAVLGGKDIHASAQSIKDSTELSNAVAADPQGIGFIGMPYVLANRALAISADARGGLRFVLPNVLTVKTEIYPISRRLFLYTPAHSAKPLVDEFVRFATSSAGQQIVAHTKFVRFDVEAPTGSGDTVVAATNAPTA